MKFRLNVKYSLAFILLLAAFLRFYRIAAYMEFLGDQGRDVAIVWRFLQKGDLMFIGPQTSIGNMYLGPWYYYLMAPFLWLARFNPVGPAVMVALFGLATVWLTWVVAKEWFGERTGTLAALMAAASPVMVYYSIFSWNPNIMPFFALLSMWLVWRIWQRGEVRKIPWLALSLAMALNSHYLGLLLFPVAGIFWLLGLKKVWKSPERKIFIRFSLFGILLFFFSASPLILFDLKHDFANFNAFKQFFEVRQTTVNFKFYKGLLKVPEIFNQIVTNLLLRKDYLTDAYFLIPLLFWGIWKERRNQATWLLLTWITVGILGLSNYKQHIYAHYYGFLYPAIILLLAVSLRHLKLLALPIVGCLIYLMLANWHGWRSPNYQLRRTLAIPKFIENKSQGDKFSLALLAKQNYDAPYRYFFTLDKAPLVDLHNGIPRQLFVICELQNKDDCKPLGNPLWEIAAFGWAKIDKEWEIKGVDIFKLIHSL